MHDVRDACRQLRRAPGFTFVVLIVLGLGTSANLALFGLLDALVLRNLPVSHPNRLVAFSAVNAKQPLDAGHLPLSAMPMFAQQQDVFASVAGYVLGGATVVN